MAHKARPKSKLVKREENPSWLISAPEGKAPKPPIRNRIQLLPFTELAWEDFERLCRVLSSREGAVVKAWAYGKAGHAQHGIDILVRMVDGSYEVWQTKRYKKYTKSLLNDAIEFFLAHDWVNNARRFVLALACEITSPELVKAIETARDKLHSKNIDFDLLDANDLTERLKTEAAIVDDYFSRPWAEKICTPEALQSLNNRVSRFEVSSIRRRLRQCYSSWIATVDPGLPIAGLDKKSRLAAAIPISERYVPADIAFQMDAEEKGPRTNTETQLPEQQQSARESDHSKVFRRVIREQRVSLDQFLQNEDQALIVADAGAGKSTLLRFIAMEMLSDKPTLKSIGERYANHIPIWIPFALWARMATQRQVPPSLEEVAAEFLRAQSGEQLAQDVRRAVNSRPILLLVDGLDEATDQAAAQTLVALLNTFIESRKVAALATSRPHGLRALGNFGIDWTRVAIAPLSDIQRLALAKIWFGVLIRLETEGSIKQAPFSQQVGRRAKAFVDAVGRSSSITRLSQTPLFLLALLALHRNGKELPRSRFAATKEIVAQLVEHQPQRRAIDAYSVSAQDMDVRLRDRLIDDFAFALQSGALPSSVTEASTPDAAIERATALVLSRKTVNDAAIARALAAEIFEFGEERAGLLVKKSEDSIGFLHLSLQEFLAGRHLARLPIAEKTEFLQKHSSLPRWREPILYLFSLSENEHETGELLRAIQSAPTADAFGDSIRSALITDAVFADFAHDLDLVRSLARQQFAELERTAWGVRERHMLSTIVEGLFSSSVGDMCEARIAQWIPDRHGYGRASAISAMEHWPIHLHDDCVVALLKSLHADNPYIWRPAARVLALLSKNSQRLKQELIGYTKSAPTTEVIAASLCALREGWAQDDAIGSTAAAFRSVSDISIAHEAIRILAKRKETTTEDLKVFFAGTFNDEKFSSELSDTDLVEYFAAYHRSEFQSLLESALHGSYERNSRRDNLVAALVYCNPQHPLLDAEIKRILATDYGFRNFFARNQFPAAKVAWTPELPPSSRIILKRSVRRLIMSSTGSPKFWPFR